MLKTLLGLLVVVVSLSVLSCHGRQIKQSRPDNLYQDKIIISSLSIQKFFSINLTSNIKDYIDHEEFRLRIINNNSRYEQEVPFVKQRLEEFKSIHKSLLKNATREQKKDIQKINHPTSLLAAVRNFLAAWEKKLANTTIYGKRLEEFLTRNITKPFPTREEYNLIATAMSIIQSTYNISVKDFRKGVVLGKKGTKLNNADCYDIGKRIFNVGLLDLASEWLEESISGYDLDQLNVTQVTFNLSDALATIARFAFKKKDKERALKLLEKANELDPDNLSVYKEFVKHRFGRDVEELLELDPKAAEPWRKKFYEMCRNTTISQPQLEKLPKLSCRLKSFRSVPYFVFKEEILSKSPYISLIRDFISSKTAESLKNKTLNVLREFPPPGFHQFDLWHFKA